MRSTRLGRFLAKPLKEKQSIVACHIKNLRSRVGRLWTYAPVVKRMEPGFLFLVWNDVVREAVLSGNFERAERKFVERFLRPGMTVLDVGAYYGLYTLTACAKVGPQGLVVAFEPAPLQRRRLRLHLWLNHFRNARVEGLALGSTEGETDFFVVSRGAEGFSGLRSPDIDCEVRTIRTKISTLANYLRRSEFSQVDFIKVDVEGGELDFFRGAESFLREGKRPVILCELQDIRTRAWGHAARDVASFVQKFGFQWFKPLSDGSLMRMPDDSTEYEGNFIAVPAERMDQVTEARY